eukprot:SAG31_NODE_4748_length_2982_cov_1.601110_1_plen_104_part_10
MVRARSLPTDASDVVVNFYNAIGRAFCNAVRIADRTSCYVVSEIIRPIVAPGLFSATGHQSEVLPALLFNLIIMRGYVNDAARFSFIGLQDYRSFDATVFVGQI